jgi:hypothetical protein
MDAELIPRLFDLFTQADRSWRTPKEACIACRTAKPAHQSWHTRSELVPFLAQHAADCGKIGCISRHPNRPDNLTADRDGTPPRIMTKCAVAAAGRTWQLRVIALLPRGNGGYRSRQRVCNFGPPKVCNLRPPFTGV